MDLTAAVDAFRFVDVQAPRRSSTGRRAYVITRSDLDFPTTPFEQTLRGIGADGGYLKGVASAAAAAPAPPLQSLAAGGFLDALSAFEELLYRKDLPEEALRAAFTSLVAETQQKTSEAVFLATPTAAVWDAYVLSVTKAATGTPPDPELQSRLALAIRVAAAIYAVTRTPADQDARLRCIAFAAISVAPDLLNTDLIRSQKPLPAALSEDTRAREMQNELILRLLTLRLAARELGAVFRDGTTLAHTPPPTAGAPRDLKEAPKLMLMVPASSFSSTTADVLRSEFGAETVVKDLKIDPLSTLQRIDREATLVGSALFSEAPPAAIAEMNGTFRLLGRELQAAGVAAVTKRLASLPLISRPTGAIGFRAPASTVNPNVRPLGVAQLKVIKQTLLSYEPGEVGHIENVLHGQLRERLHSVKQRTEESITVESEVSTSSEKDLQSTDRFEMSQETTSTISEQRQNEAGITVTASYGAVSISANTKYSDTASRQQGEKLSRNFAREVVDRSIERVQQRVREERVRKTTLEVEETNRHTLSAPAKSVVGVYRWVDKIYWAQIHVYGKRLMLEFMLPEPAAVYLYGATRKPADPTAVEPPPALTIDASDIQRYNYTALAAKYGAEVEAPPPAWRLSRYGAHAKSDTDKGKVELEDGWVGLWAAPNASWVGTPGKLYIHVGNEIWDTSGAGFFDWRQLSDQAAGQIPVTVTPFQVTIYNVVATIVSEPGEALFQKWQLDTYKALAAAYALKKSDYDAYLTERARSQSELPIKADQENRAIERQEIQRGCIEMLTQEHFQGQGGMTTGGSWPTIDFAAADALGPRIQFLQQSFEWDQMTYVFYPYFWADQTRWGDKMSASGGDALFNRFLSAGYARVVVPVRPAHEIDVSYYINVGTPWSGGEPPIVGDATYVDIIDELKETLDAPDDGVPEGDPWQFKVPTSLVLLDDSGALPAWPDQAPPSQMYAPSEETCGGVPYNIAQWKDATTIADAIRKLGYLIPVSADQALALVQSRAVIRAMQKRFNGLGAASVLGRNLAEDGIVGPCTLRVLTYFDALKAAGKWPGAA